MTHPVACAESHVWIYLTYAQANSLTAFPLALRPVSSSLPGVAVVTCPFASGPSLSAEAATQCATCRFSRLAQRTYISAGVLRYISCIFAMTWTPAPRRHSAHTLKSTPHPVTTLRKLSRQGTYPLRTKMPIIDAPQAPYLSAEDLFSLLKIPQGKSTYAPRHQAFAATQSVHPGLPGWRSINNQHSATAHHNRLSEPS